MYYTLRSSSIGHPKTIAGLPYIITIPWTYRRERGGADDESRSRRSAVEHAVPKSDDPA